MIRRQKTEEQSGPIVPAYIVTFSDMVTLLLTFFVMLLSLASTQDPDMFKAGRDSFMESLSGFGLGMFTGRIQRPDFGHVKIKYHIGKSDEIGKDRNIDIIEENIRRIFKDVDESMKSIVSQLVSKKTDFQITNIRFSAGDATLSKSSKRFLASFSSNLQQDPDFKTIKLCVLGLAGEQKSRKEQWILSARRAQTVADFLKNTLPSYYDWPVYSWGAGPGGDWVDKNSFIYEQSQILIAVLRTND